MDASLLSREYVQYDDGGDDQGDGVSPSPAVGPHLVRIKASEEDRLLRWLAEMIGEYPEPCEPCGRQQAGCLECDMGSECNSWQMVRFAHDPSGRMRMQAVIILEPPMMFGGDEQTIRQLAALLEIDEIPRSQKED